MKKILFKNFLLSMLFLASFMLEKGRASDGCFKEHKDCAEALETLRGSLRPHNCHKCLQICSDCELRCKENEDLLSECKGNLETCRDLCAQIGS